MRRKTIAPTTPTMITDGVSFFNNSRDPNSPTYPTLTTVLTSSPTNTASWASFLISSPERKASMDDSTTASTSTSPDKNEATITPASPRICCPKAMASKTTTKRAPNLRAGHSSKGLLTSMVADDGFLLWVVC